MLSVRVPRVNQHAAGGRHPSLSPAADVSFSSDKENNTRARPVRQVSGTKRSAAAMAGTEDPALATAREYSESSDDDDIQLIPVRTKQKRGALSERDGVQSSQQSALNATQTSTQARTPARDGSKRRRDTRYYDPEQPMSERRDVRKKLRDLHKNLLDSRNEYMAADSNGLRNTVKKANEIFADVKQTSDATLDSRLLVQAGDIGARRAAQVKLGAAAGGVTVDEFVTKAIQFMRRGPSEEEAEQIFPPGSTQRQGARSRRNRTVRHDDYDDGDDEEAGDGRNGGDELNWEWFGRAVAYPNMLRPSTTTFLLGPLSVQKKARKVTQRTARQRPLDLRDAVRPDELKADELERNDNKNLTTMCRMIMELLSRTTEEGVAAVEAEAEARERDGVEMSNEEVAQLMEKHNMREDGGVCLFRFAFNPQDFGQTVENIFYISFLIRDGRAGIGFDRNGYMTLHATKPSGAGGGSSSQAPASTASGRGAGAGTAERNQGVFHLDHSIWRKLCKAYGVTKSVIPHREKEEAQETVAGWYG